MAGPAIAPTPTIDIIEPIAFPLSDSGNVAIAIAIPVPCVIAAPAPWISRAIIRVARLSDEPDIRAPPMNTAEPKIKTRFNPIKSATLPIGSKRALMTNTCPITTHWTVGKTV